MKQTNELGLNLLESSDLLSVKPMNENMRKLETAVLANAESASDELKAAMEELKKVQGDDVAALNKVIAGKVMMATGTYTGTGDSSVSIVTPGFKPLVLLMRVLRGKYSDGWDVDVDLHGASMGDYECPGFTMWNGKNLNSRYQDYDATVKFAATDDGLSWELVCTAVSVSSAGRQVNNKSGEIYEWVAFGMEAG